MLSRLLRPDPRPWWPWLAAALVVKAIIIAGFSITRTASGLPITWVIPGGDTLTYLAPIESLLAGHGYDPDYRMPGYGAVYLLFRLFGDAAVAKWSLVIGQGLLDAIAVLFLARLALLITGSARVFLAVFVLYTGSVFVTCYDNVLLTDAFSTSALVFAAYHLVLYLKEGGRKRVLLAGAWLAWLIFLRPVYAPLLPMAAVLVLLQRTSWRERLVPTLCLLLPFVLADGAWIARNAVVHRRLTVLTNGQFLPEMYNTPYHAMSRMMRAVGGDFCWWYPDAEVRWFNVKNVLAVPGAVPHGGVPFPERMLTKAFPEDSLAAVADAVLAWYNTEDRARRTVLKTWIDERAEDFVQAYRTEHPWQYHVVSPVRVLYRFIGNGGTALIFPAPRSSVGLTARAVAVALFVFAVPAGLLCAFIAVFRRRWPRWALFVPLIVLYTVLLHALVLRYSEQRYLLPVYPFGLLLSVWAVDGPLTRKGSRSYSPSSSASVGAGSSHGRELL